jgi:hypothetical protein
MRQIIEFVVQNNLSMIDLEKEFGLFKISNPEDIRKTAVKLTG